MNKLYEKSDKKTDNKINKTAYMFLILAAAVLCGCTGKGPAQMYLQAEIQDAETQDGIYVQESGTDIQEHGNGNTPAGHEEKTAGTVDSDSDGQMCFVYVCGAVKHPGVFELPQGSRVYEALALAGGLRKDAYAKELNQAEQIADGQMIEVLTKKEYKDLYGQTQQTDRDTKETGKPQDRQKNPQSGKASGDTSADGRIDLNTATKEELMTLSGIGEAKAANIIAYRESSGGFSAPEEIMNVSGIGEGVYARIQDKIAVIQ